MSFGATIAMFGILGVIAVATAVFAGPVAAIGPAAVIFGAGVGLVCEAIREAR